MSKWKALENSAKQLRIRGRYWRNFHPGHLMGWLLCGGKCAYCGKVLVGETIDYGSATTDHLLPKRQYPHLRDEALNSVLACFDCNSRKGRWAPSEEVTKLTEDTRKRLIEEAWAEIQKRKVTREEAMADDLEHWSRALMDAGLGQ